jgi:hypothetical protein
MLRIISNRDSNSVTVQALDKNAQEILLRAFPDESRIDYTEHSWHFKDAYVYYENQIVTIVSSKDSKDKYQKKLFVTSLVNTIIEFR